MDSSPKHSNPDTGVKKSPFDDLDKEELISKCKGLLVIAQKAKTAKSELQKEIETYKIQLEKCDSVITQNQVNNKLLQELVDSVDSAQSKIKELSVQCNNYNHEINQYKADLIIKDQMISDVSQKLSDSDSELKSFERENKRLMEENEQLINQLTEGEARTEEFNNIVLKQREQLQLLEMKFLSDECKSNIEILHNKIKELEDQIKTVKDEKSKQNTEFEDKINEFTQTCELEKNKNEKLNVKLRSYKDKISKCAACINQLKNSRFILTKTVKEYSENIPKWQDDIIKASKVLDDQVNALRNENVSLNEKVHELEEQLKQAVAAIHESVVTVDSAQTEELKNVIDQLEAQIVKLQKQLSDSSSHNDKVQQELNELKSKYEVLINTELPMHVAENKSLKEQINNDIIKLNESTKKIKELNLSLEELNIEREKINKSIQNNDQNNDFIESLTFQIKALESEKSTLVKEKLNAKDSVIELENIKRGLEDQVANMKTEIKSMKTELESTVQEKNVMENKYKNENEGEINMLRCKIMELEEQFSLMKKEYDDMQDMNNLLKEEVETMKFSLEQPKDDSEHSDLNVSLQTDIAKLETKLSAYKQENASLLIEMKESRIKIKEYDALVSEYDDAKSKLMSYKNENAELLHEMKEINQVLKERGESISKKQKAIAEMERLIETLEKDRSSLNEEKTTLREKIENLETQIANAEKKTTEVSGVVNQTALERDNVKKELAEKESLIESLKEDIEKFKQTPTSVAAELPNEDMSTSTISKAEEFSRMRDLDETFEEKYTKLRIFALKLKKKLNETTAVLQNSEQDKAKLEKMLSEQEIKSTVADNNENETNRNNQWEVTELRDTIHSLTKESAKLSTELENMKAELNLKNQELSSEINAHKATKDNLEKARRDAKKKNVLSLEIEDYERSLKELTTKMEEKKKKMVQMESTIDTQEGTITAMKIQIKLLEEQIKTEETQNRLTKEELQHIMEEGKDKDSVIQAKNGIILKLEQELEDEKRKNEEADLEMTAMMSDKEKVIMSLGEDKAELNNKVKRLEFKCSELNENLKIVNMELADLKTEYTSYKVRAQAVLRQNQTVDHSQEEQLKEEAAALKAQIDSLTVKLSTAQEQCLEQTTEAENARRRASEASSEATRAQQRTTRLHADLTRLSQHLESERAQNKLQVSTLTQCYKTQISDLEAKLQKETELLKKQLATVIESAKVGKTDDSNQNSYMLPVIPKDDSDGEMDINVSMIPREEGEGSESAPSPPPSKTYFTTAGSGRSPVSLERLLEEGVPDDESLDTSSLAITTDQEISELKRRLTAQQQRVKHVTVLLSESERECARMAQLSELLKAELRRVRGTSHNAHNAEYMKNVTLKFLTLPPGDERGRLVPVLQKILTLTNDETQKIHAIAKGLDPNPNKGWGSYLPWPGGSK